MRREGDRRPLRAGGVGIAVALLALLGAQALLQSSFERRHRRRVIENLLYIPTGGGLRAMSLGFNSVYADLLWMRAIGYFGSHALTDRDYPWLHHILDQVTSLDPTFRMPYVFGGVALAVEAGAAEQSTRLLLKGMRRYPGEWRFPFYVGFNYFYYLKDPVRAADFMRLAASLPGHPEYLPRLAASLQARAGRVETAIAFLETMAEGVREEHVRRSLLQKIEDLRTGRIPEGLRGFLEGTN